MTKPLSLILALFGGFMIVFGGLKAAVAANSQNCNREYGCTSITTFPDGTGICNGAFDTPCSPQATCQPCVGVSCLGLSNSHSCVCTQGGGYLRADCWTCVVDDAQGNVVTVTCVDATCNLPNCEVLIDPVNFKAWCDCF